MLAGALLAALPVRAAEVAAGAPTAYSVTVYRAEDAAADSQDLHGFALITETRTVSLPAGQSRLRFAGVAANIEASSALLSGLPADVLERNEDAKLLSPASLAAATIGRHVWLRRLDRLHGTVHTVPGTLRAQADGLVFQSAEGVEALRCSGLPETFQFDGTGDLAPTPTLSVRVRTAQPIAATVQLSYLSGAFDWHADYTAYLDADGSTMALGGWVTLDNGNASSFPAAHTQVVAGRVSHEAAPPDEEPPMAILANCWARGTTSDQPLQDPTVLGREERRMFKNSQLLTQAVAAPAMVARMVSPEALGDLKLYRIPEPTTIASLERKQVRLLDRPTIAVQTVFGIDAEPGTMLDGAPAQRWLRTRNDRAHGLGLALPAGHVVIFLRTPEGPVRLAEAPLRDTSEDEALEIAAGSSESIQVSSHPERTSGQGPTRVRVDITSQRSAATPFELRLRLPPGVQLSASPAPRHQGGRSVMALTVPPGATMSLRYALKWPPPPTRPGPGR